MPHGCWNQRGHRAVATGHTECTHPSASALQLRLDVELRRQLNNLDIAEPVAELIAGAGDCTGHHRRDARGNLGSEDGAGENIADVVDADMDPGVPDRGGHRCEHCAGDRKLEGYPTREGGRRRGMPAGKRRGPGLPGEAPDQRRQLDVWALPLEQ